MDDNSVFCLPPVKR